jgi:hypothetical protein
MADEKSNVGPTMAFDGSGWITRSDGSGSISKGSQVKVRPAPPAPIIKAQASTSTLPPPKFSKKK